MRPLAPSPAPEAFTAVVPSPGGRLFAKVWGAAPGAGFARTPIVLLHESLGSVEVWREFPAQLAAATGRPVVAYDRLGFGRSDPYPGAFPPDFIAREAGDGFAALRQALGIEDFIAFGHSVGGGMAVGVAAAHPQACRALITLAAQSFVEEVTRDGIRAAKAAFAQPGQMDKLARYHGEKAAFVLSAWVDSWLAPGFDGWTLDDALPRISCPVLVLHGADDEYASPAQPRRIAAGVAGPVALDILPGCGHVPHREHPELVLSSVTAFLRAHLQP
ncbi:alpha/beta fold hydrolase [Azorhizobium doebereinerae]|uniref:alpha/beta fold hydrolase n=1 Tax=Azorhizobium doebereinerae TaxID=281091 RepID=UPI0004224A2B|nr:alpha/beta hydrolase [Azorhizobium doebereinerae]